MGLCIRYDCYGICDAFKKQMSWKRLQSQHDGLGTIVNVLVNEQEGLISRTFQAGYQTVSGKKHEYTQEQVNEFYQNELYFFLYLFCDHIRLLNLAFDLRLHIFHKI